MGRRTRKGSRPQAPNILKIEVSDKYIKIRFIAAIIFLMVAAVSIGYGVSLLTRVDKGWQIISISDEGTLYADEFVLFYELGASEKSARSESRELKQLYSGACQAAGKAFDGNVESPGNLRALNNSPNQVIELDPVLYEALKLLELYGNRTIYLGPAFRLYESIFFCTEDWQLKDFDPEQNKELQKLFERIAAFAGDPDSVRVELLEDNTGMLYVSEEYLAFLQYEELGGALDFGWMKNAFITDFIADTLANVGYTRGNVSSIDGYIRNMDDQRCRMYSLNIFDFPDRAAIQAARLDYQGSMAFVSYRNFPVIDMDARRIYITEDGERKTLYLSLQDGLPHTGAASLTAYSGRLSCAEILLLSSSVYQQEHISGTDLARLAEQSVQSVLVVDRKLLTTETEAVLAGIYDGYTIEMVTK